MSIRSGLSCGALAALRGAAWPSVAQNASAAAMTTVTIHFMARPADRLWFFPTQGDKPVYGRDQHRSADDIADRDRYEISEDEIGPGQGREVRGGLADRSPERVAGA